jgi:methylated-DNA-[protein]-cysteine S-methyltransferase
MMERSVAAKGRSGARAFETKAGWIGVVASAKGIAAVLGPYRTARRVLAGLPLPNDDVGSSVEALLERAERQLTAYFAGRRVTFDLPLDLTGQPPFRRKVLLEAAKIPCGQTTSYGELARRVGSPRAARAVGQAMARNPVAPIVPCHRVIGADGSLVGFGGGLEAKARLLKMERGACP